MEDELTKNGSFYENLETIMRTSAVFREFPHHLLLFENFVSYAKMEENQRLDFYRDHLRRVFAKGLIITFQHDKQLTSFMTQLVSIVCWETLLEIDTSEAIPTILHQQHLVLRKDALFPHRPVQIIESMEAISIIYELCDIGNPGFRLEYALQDPLYCMYYFLLSSYNVTFQPYGEMWRKSEIKLRHKHTFL